MAVSFYVMPGVIDTDPVKGYARHYGKYWYTTLVSYAKQQFYMGIQDTWIVGVESISGADDATLVTDATVTKIPPLANNVGAGPLATVKAKLETYNLPADWVIAGTLYQSIMHYSCTFCLFMQKYNGVDIQGPLLFDGTVTLDTAFNALSAQVQAALIAAATALGLSTAGLSGATKLRSILKSIGDQWPTVVGPIVLQGVTL